MKKIITLTMIILWFSDETIANQVTINDLEKGGDQGIARYYAANLKGKLTSFGEKYDDSQLTASHSKYPLNTLVKVTNLENSLSVQVRINDYCKCEEEGKIINLSKEAASRLGMMVSGKAKVSLEVISLPNSEKMIDKTLDNLLTKGREINSKEEKKETKEIISVKPIAPLEPFLVNHTFDIAGIEKSPKGFGVQITALSSLDMIQDLNDELIKMGVKKEEIYVQVGEKNTGKIYRLIFGEFYTKEMANEKLTWLSQHGYKGVIRSHYNF